MGREATGLLLRYLASLSPSPSLAGPMGYWLNTKSTAVRSPQFKTQQWSPANNSPKNPRLLVVTPYGVFPHCTQVTLCDQWNVTGMMAGHL